MGQTKLTSLVLSVLLISTISVKAYSNSSDKDKKHLFKEWGRIYIACTKAHSVKSKCIEQLKQVEQKIGTSLDESELVLDLVRSNDLEDFIGIAGVLVAKTHWEPESLVIGAVQIQLKMVLEGIVGHREEILSFQDSDTKYFTTRSLVDFLVMTALNGHSTKRIFLYLNELSKKSWEITGHYTLAINRRIKYRISEAVYLKKIRYPALNFFSIQTPFDERKHYFRVQDLKFPSWSIGRELKYRFLRIWDKRAPWERDRENILKNYESTASRDQANFRFTPEALHALKDLETFKFKDKENSNSERKREMQEIGKWAKLIIDLHDLDDSGPSGGHKIKLNRNRSCEKQLTQLIPIKIRN